MATTDAGNLEIQQQLNELMAQRAAQIEKLNQLLNEQVRLTSAIRDAAASGSGLEKTNADLNSMSGALKDVAGKMGGLGKEIDSVTKQSLEMAPKLRVAWSVFASGINAVKKAFDTVIQAGSKFFSKTKDQLMSTVGLLGAMTRGIAGISGALLAIPLKIMSFLQQKAADAANASQALREAYEEVRDRFGDLASNEGKAVIDSYKDLTQQSNNLAGSGRSLSSIFGYGPEGLATAMKYAAETADAMGPTFNVLKDQFEESAAEIVIMRKGLDLSAEAMLGLSREVLARGGNIKNTMQEISNLAVQMGKKYGISSKEVGRSLGYMIANTAKFGSMTKAQMATSAIYVKKLGLEIKDLEGIMGAFDDFESAATNASKLAQAFGMNIDAMQMMKEQDPSKRLDMLRKAFAATGKSIESMSRQEKALLAQTSGLDANLVEAALSAKNMGKSYDEIKAAAEGAADKQLSQEEIMQNMGNNIKKALRPLELVASLLENFFNGIMVGLGIFREGGFGDVFSEISKALIAFKYAGIEVGKMLKSFLGPNVKSISDIYKVLAEKVKLVPPVFERFFKALKEGNTSGAVSGLIEDIKNLVTSFFGADNFSSLKDTAFKWMKMAFEFLAEAAAQMLPEITNTLVDALDYLIASVPEKIGEVDTDSVKTPFTKLFDGLVDLAVKVLPKVWELFKKVFVLLWNDPKTSTYFKAGLLGLFTYVFGPGLIAAVGVIGTLALGVASFISSIFFGAIGILVRNPEMSKKIFKWLSTKLDDALKLLAPAASKTFKEFAEKGFGKVAGKVFSTLGGTLVGKFIGGFIGKLALGVGSGGLALAIEYGLKLIRWFSDTLLRKAATSIFGEEWGNLLVNGFLLPLEMLIDGWDNFFGGLFDTIWGLISGIFTGDWTTLKSGATEMARGLAQFLIGAMLSPVTFIIPIGTALNKVLKDSFGVDVKTLVGSWMPKWAKDFGSTVYDFIGKGIFGYKEELEEAGKNAAMGLGEGTAQGLEASQKTAEEKLSSVTSMVGNYADKTVEDIAREGERLNNGLRNINNLVKSIDKTTLSDIEKNLGGVNIEFVEKSKGFMESLSQIVGSYLSISDGLKKLKSSTIDTNSVTNLFDSIKVLSKYLSDLKSDASFNLQIIGGIVITNMVSQLFVKLGEMVENYEKAVNSIPSKLNKKYIPMVKAIVEDIRTVNEELASLGDIDINATVAKVGDKLGIKDEVIRIERKPIEMNVKFNLTLKAEDVAKEIFEAAYKIATTTPGEGTVSPGRGITRAMIQ